LAALDRGVSRRAAGEIRTWQLENAQLGLCGDAASAESREPAALLLFEGKIHDRSGLLDELNLHDSSLSDASLLLHAWLRFQEDFPNHIVGEYCFALWEAHRRRLILGSDPLGRQALFYWQSGDCFRFASEIGGLLACREIPTILDGTKVAHWLTRHSDSDDETLYKSIRRVPAGHVLLLEDGKLRLHCYWHPEERPTLREADPRGYAEGLLFHLEQAVRCRVETGGTIGSHLSGGLDSSTVTTLSAEILAGQGRASTAFTAVPASPLTSELDDHHFGDERYHAASVVEHHSNLTHILIPNNATPFFDALDYFSSEHFDPIPNAANAPWIVGILAESRRRGIQTLLSGSVGNLTASYNGRYALSELLVHGRLFAWIRMVRDRQRLGSSIRGSLSQSLGNGPVQLRFRRAVHDRLMTPLRRWRGIESQKQPDLDLYAVSPIHPDFFRSSGLPAQLECHSFLQPSSSRLFRLQMLKQGQGSAASTAAKRCFGLELTDPMADRRLVEYCISLPEEAFCQGGMPRSLIRDAMKGKLPDKVRLEQRIGLQAADAATLMAANREGITAEVRLMQASDLANRYLDMPALARLVEEWPSGEFPDQKIWFAYVNKLLRGVSFGRFLRRVEDGSLFSSVRQAASAPST
jgi:asparagine synthase (glutamine-hydrolysing)